MSRFLARMSVNVHIAGRTAMRGGKRAKMRDWTAAPMRSHVERERLLRMRARPAVVGMVWDGKEEIRGGVTSKSFQIITVRGTQLSCVIIQAQETTFMQFIEA